MFRRVLGGLAALVFALGASSPASAVSLLEGWWYNPAQSGRGWAISYRDYSRLFLGGFYYDEAGAPAWVISSMVQTGASMETITTPTGTTYKMTYTLEGDLVSCARGGPLADQTPAAPSCMPVGKITMQTDSPSKVRLTIDRTGAARVVIDLVPFTAY